ncbi:MAG: RNA methyltransferase [Halobacteriales archaeon]|nr:RNA methyltransferase [Halobacteriales archaeon]
MTRTVLVPSSLVREADDKQDATRKLGIVARAAVVFRVDRIGIFPDPDGEDGEFGGEFVETVLAYAATPPYLRKDVWDRRDELAAVGLLPPLQVSSQTGSGSDDSGSLRQGIVTEVGSDGRVRVNCGMQHPISLIVPDDMSVDEGERVTIRVSSRRPVRARIVDEPPPGFTIQRTELTAALDRADAGLRIATSRHGEELTVSRLARLTGRLDGGMTLAFGAPGRGLPAILGIDPADVQSAVADAETSAVEPESDTDAVGTATDAGAGFDLWLNTVPHQGSDIVRTEEAMFASLATLTLTE